MHNYKLVFSIVSWKFILSPLLNYKFWEEKIYILYFNNVEYSVMHLVSMYWSTTFGAVDKIIFFLRKTSKAHVAKSKTSFPFFLPLNTLRFAQSSWKSPLPIKPAKNNAPPIADTRLTIWTHLSNNKWVRSYVKVYSCFLSSSLDINKNNFLFCWTVIMYIHYDESSQNSLWKAGPHHLISKVGARVERDSVACRQGSALNGRMDILKPVCSEALRPSTSSCLLYTPRLLIRGV